MNFDNNLRSVSVFICCNLGLMVLMIVKVDGQATTDDADGDVFRRLVDTVIELRTELDRMKAEKNEEQKGTSYIRWGKKTCEGNATLVYKGYSAGPHYSQGGSGSNFLCLPDNPQWKRYMDGQQSHTGAIAGIEYEMFDAGTYVFSEANNGPNPIRENPASCAVCYVGGRTTVLMIPARTQCPNGWTTEYQGYLVSDISTQTSRKRSSYICLDETPEIVVGGTSQNQAVIYPVEALCGTLPCSLYPTGRELTCIVCSK